MRFITKTLTVLALSLAVAKTHAVETFVVEDIQVEGLQRVELGTFFTALPIRVGETLDDARVPNVIRALYKTGNFDFVKLEKEGNTLKITVAERPVISSIVLTGNKVLKTEQLMDGLRDSGIAEGEVLDNFVLEKMEQAIQGQYYSNGHYHLDIEKKISGLSRNRVQLQINIKEGAIANIKSINIVGNERFPDDVLLNQIESTAGGFFSYLTSDNKYSSTTLNKDIETIESYYRDRGYLKFKVDSPLISLSANKEEVYITLNVSEGSIYKVRNVKFAGKLIYEQRIFENTFPLNEGDNYSQALVSFNEEQLKTFLGLGGYTFAEISTFPEIIDETNEVDLTVVVSPGDRFYAKNISFKGNQNTDDSVFRREVRIQEGTPLSSSLLERSKLRIQQLPYIEEVNYDVKRSAEDGNADVEFSVKERNSSEVSFSLGYNDFFGLQLQGALTNRNFLGEGKTLGLNLNTNKAISNISFNYSDPYFFDDTIGFNSSFSYSKTDFSEFNTVGRSLDTISVGAGLYYPITETASVSFGLKYQANTLNAPLQQNQQDQRIIDFFELLNVDPIIENQVDFDLITADLGIQINTLNRFIFPTKGYSHRAGIELSTPAGDVEYYKFTYDYRHYFPINDEWIVLLRGNLGFGDGLGDTDRLPYFVNFYAGGSSSLRGFESNTIGPKSIQRRIASLLSDSPFPGVPTTGVALPSSEDRITINNRFTSGGNAKLFTSLELIFPTPFVENNNNVRTSAFIDVGNVWDTKFNPERFDGLEITNANIMAIPDYSDPSTYRASYGLSFQWWSPFAPLQFSLSKTLRSEEFDETKTFSFTIGQTF